MKKFRFFMVAAFVAICASVSAQQVITLDQLQKQRNQKAAKQETPKQAAKQAAPKQTSASSAYENFNTAIVQYNAASMKVSYDGHSSSSGFSGLSAGYLMAFNIADMPLYVEPGGILQFFFKSQDGHKMNVLSLKVPASFIYSFQVSDTFIIDPFAGPYVRVNLFGKGKAGGESTDLFSEDDMGGEPWKRVQFGLQLGARARISDKYTVGLGYSMDLSELTDHTKISSFDLTFGLNL